MGFQIWGSLPSGETTSGTSVVGAMVVGGLFTIFKLRSNLASGIREAIAGIKGGQMEAKKRTDTDLNFKFVFLMIGLLVIPVFLIYAWLSSLWVVSAVMAVFAILFAFIASAIAGYMAGLLGSSNNPISGVTVSVLLITSLNPAWVWTLRKCRCRGNRDSHRCSYLLCCCDLRGRLTVDDLWSDDWCDTKEPTDRRNHRCRGCCPDPCVGDSSVRQGVSYRQHEPPAPQAFLMQGIVQGVLGGDMVWPFVVAGAVLRSS